MDKSLNNIIEIVARGARPERIVLFGSRAREESKSESDVDLLVIKKGANKRKLSAEIYRNLIGVRYPVDLVIVTPEDIEKYGNSPALVIHPALKEGKIVYAR